MTRMIKIHFFLLSTVILFSLCTRLNTEIPVVTLNEVDNEIDLKFTDIATDIRAVILELAEDNLIGDRSKFIIGNKFILCFCRDYILQYSINGKFIRRLASKGAGPDELTGFSTFGSSVNSSETFLYCRNKYNDGKISCINLESGNFEKSIPLAYGETIETITSVNDDELLIVPSNWAESDFLYFFQDLKGNLIDGLRMKREAVIQIPRFNSPTILGDEFLYYHSTLLGDTVFLIGKSGIKPYFLLDGGEPCVLFEKKGYITIIRGILQQYYFIDNWLVDVNGAILESNNYIIDSEDIITYKLRSFKNDLIGSEYADDKLMVYYYDNIITNSKVNNIAIKVDAIHFKNSIASNSTGIHPEYLDQMLEIDSVLSENDNPVLLIGKSINLRLD